MFDINKILKRAWQILWNYRVMWFFGFLLALTGSGGGGAGGGSGYSGNFNSQIKANPAFGGNLANQAWAAEFTTWMSQNFGRFFDTQAHAIQSIIWAAVIITVVGILCSLVFALVRYPAETAVMRMVDELETSGQKHTIKTGWKLGWNRRAFRIWLIDTIIAVPILLIVIGFAAGIGLGVYNLVQNSTSVVNMTGAITGLVLGGLLFIPVAMLFALVGIVREFIVRFAALEDTNVGESFSRGWQFFKQNLKHALLIWLILIAVGIAAGVALMVAFVILIPTYVILAIPGALVAAIPGAIGYGITTFFSTHVWPWVIGALVAIPFFFSVVFAPLTFVSGWVSLFRANVWTLTYRQLKGLTVPPVPVVTPEPEQTEKA